jgi:DNA-binding NtrC family response regulator
VITVTIPPLRERIEDLPLLVDYFIKQVGRRRTPLAGISDRAMQALAACPWRGNVRELENLVQHMTVLYAGETVQLADLPEKYRNPSGDAGLQSSCMTRGGADVSGPEQLSIFSAAAAPPSPPAEEWSEEGIDFKAMVNDFESQLIIQALKMTKGNKKEAARILNLKRTTLLEKIKKKNLQDLWQEE